MKNQCDGCARKLPVRGKIHRDKNGSIFMCCQKERYTMTHFELLKTIVLAFFFWAAFMVCLFLVSPKSFAAELQTGIGAHYTNGAIVLVRSDNKTFDIFGGGWTGTRDNMVAGADITLRHRCIIGRVGGAYVLNTGERIGTHGNFEVYLGCKIKSFEIGWLHFSNGDAIFSDNDNHGRDGENLGEDFITITFRF